MGLTKWILTGLGWSIGGGPLGALVGYLIGKGFESLSANKQIEGDFSHSSTNHRRYKNTGSQADVNIALVALMAAVMKSDNQIKKSELDYVKRFLVNNYGEEKAKELLLRLRDLNSNDIPLNDLCLQIKTNTDYTTRYHMVDFLYGLAKSDGDISAAEQSTLRFIGTHLGLNLKDLLSIQSRHFSQSDSYWSRHDQSRSYSSSQSSKDPYAVLGLTSSASDDEIKKAYRRYAMKYHPDKVATMSEDVKRNAEEQFKEINAAYETLKNLRGFK